MNELQDWVFAAFEGDCYWKRNAKPLEQWDPATDPPCQLLREYNLRPRSVMEIGAANGFRLAHLHEQYGSEAVGIDSSGQAVADGLARWPGVRMLTGTAADVPWQEPCELVIVNFVLHWVDRSTLLKSIAEIDRLICDGGFVILGDFAPDNKLAVDYHHRSGLRTYKQDYAAVLRASGLYHPVAYKSGGHGRPGDPFAGEDTRTGTWLLRKRLTDHYITRAYGGVGPTEKG